MPLGYVHRFATSAQRSVRYGTLSAGFSASDVDYRATATTHSQLPSALVVRPELAQNEARVDLRSIRRPRIGCVYGCQRVQTTAQPPWRQSSRRKTWLADLSFAVGLLRAHFE